MKLSKISLFLSLTVFSCVADPMQDIFNDMYSTTAPSASQHGNGRYGVNLGGFTYRPKLSDGAPIVSARLPNASLGPCGEIDIFAGSFSLISGDELAQLSRGIMQGAATYAFNLALQSISPMAAGVVEELRTLINGVNQFNIDGCKKGAEWAANALASDTPSAPSTEMGFVAKKLQSINMSLGFAADMNDATYGAESQKSASALASQVGKKINNNSLLKPLSENQPNGDLFRSFSSVKDNELILTILGAVLTSTDLSNCTTPITDEGTCITRVPGKGAPFFIDLFYDADDIDSDVEDVDLKYYKCADVDCINVVNATITTKRILPMIRKSIFDIWQKTYKTPTVKYTDTEAKIMYWFGNDMYLMMQVFGPHDEFGRSYARYKALEATLVIMDYMANDLVSQVRTSLVTSKNQQTGEQLYPVGLNQAQDDLLWFKEAYTVSRNTDIQKRVFEDRARLDAALTVTLSTKK
jgi:hypothetical protein